MSVPGAPARGRPASGRPEGAAGCTPAPQSLALAARPQLRPPSGDKARRPSPLQSEATTENSGRGQTQCRKRDRIQVPRPAGRVAGPTRAHSMSPLWPLPRDRLPSVPAATCSTSHATGRAERGGGGWIGAGAMSAPTRSSPFSPP